MDTVRRSPLGILNQLSSRADDGADQLHRDKGTPTYYAFDSLDGIPGQMVSVTEPSGRIVQASVYFVDQRLYIAEGSAEAGGSAPSQFMQSIQIIDPEGERIVLDPD